MDIYVHSSGDRTPYTYLIGWKKLNIWYYGVRYGKNCHPLDLFVSYFTSSKYVAEFIKDNGSPDIIQIRKVFNDINKARDWEDKVINRMKMVKDSKYLNRCGSKGIDIDKAGHSRGRTYEQIYGEEKAKELKLLRSESNRTRKLKKKDYSIINHGNKGIIHGVEQKIAMLQGRNKHFTLVSQCAICFSYFKNKLNAKYCSRSCSNRSRKSKRPG